MSHARQQIRERIARLTLAGLAPLTGSGKVYESRAYPMSAFPVVAVYNGPETVQVENPGYINGGTKRYRRHFDVSIDVVVLGNNDPDGELDTLCLAVEHAMYADDNMGGGVVASDLASVSHDISGIGDKDILVCRMVYRVEYRVEADAADTFIM